MTVHPQQSEGQDIAGKFIEEGNQNNCNMSGNQAIMEVEDRKMQFANYLIYQKNSNKISTD